MFTVVAAAVLAATTALPSLPHSPDLYVSGFFSSSVQRYTGPRNAAPGVSTGPYARGVSRRPWGLALGPDGNLYVANLAASGGAVIRVKGPFDSTPGGVDVFIDESGGAAMDLVFGPDQNLYIGSRGPVRRYDAVTGKLIDEFTKGYTLAEVRGVAFGPDGNLYVSNYDSCVSGPTGCTGQHGEIVRFDGFTGKFIDVYVPSGRGGLVWPYDLAFGPTGDLFVANATPDGGNVLRFMTPLRAPTGIPIPTLTRRATPFASRAGMNPLAIAFGPDGNLYVSSSDNSGGAGSVLRFDGHSGAFIDVFLTNVDGGPRGLAFGIGAR